MAWAVRAHDRHATYIGALSRRETGLACGCICPACEGILQAVNAGMPPEHFLKPDTMRPFFRHHTGQQKTECLRRVAQIAALQLLFDSEEIDLPAPVARRSVQGASGTVYTGDAVGSRTRARVVARHWVDTHAARITLDDGRVVLLQLTGRVVGSDDSASDAIVMIDVDDPEVSTWPPEKILQHAQLDGRWLCWERHWDDGALQAEALARAEEEARRLVDLAPDDYRMPEGLTPLQRSESVVHWVIKEILATAGQLKTPAVHEVVTARMPDGRDQARTISFPPATLELSEVRIEHDLGGIVPDILCRAVDSEGRLAPMDLMVEVAVTHRVDDIKRARIQQRGLGCIEFDVDLLDTGGRITRDRLRSIVLGEPANKRWIRHPDLERQRERARHELEIASDRVAEAMIQSQRKLDWFRGLSVEQAAQEYLEALRASWRGRRSVDRNGVTWLPEELAPLLEGRGFKELGDQTFSGSGGILHTLDRIRAVALAGQKSMLSYTALSDALEEDGDDRRFASLILLATHLHRPMMEEGDALTLARRRERIKQSISDGEARFARPSTWDGLLGILFPEMAPGLGGGYGTAAYAATLQAATREAQRLAASEARQADNERRAEARRHQEAQALRDEVQTELTSVATRMRWAERDGSVPIDVATAVRFGHEWRKQRTQLTATQFHNMVESAWTAREQGLSVRQWIESRRPSDPGKVSELAGLLAASWLSVAKKSPKH